MKRIFLLFFLLLSVITLDNNACVTYAQTDTKVSNKFSYMYDYGVTTPVNKETKVYIDESMVDFIKSTNREVFEEIRTTFFIPRKKYYYIANEFVEKVVSVRQIYNDVDSLIFMLRQLESEAIKQDSIHYKNIVLGYIRSINKEYAGDSYFGKWDVVAGAVSLNFINTVDNDYSHGLRFCDYFGSFIKYELYNLDYHPDMLEKYKRRNSELKFIDNNYNSLDLIHMFASIDGIYADTGNSLTCGRNNLQRDICSWNGDLQQACKYLKNNNVNLNANSNADTNSDANSEANTNSNADKIKFTDAILKNEESQCGIEDVISDIDAMNITYTYINSEENTISNAISAYYSLIDDNKTFRYKMFIDSVIIDEEDHIDTYSKLDRFKHEIYFQFNLKEENNQICDSQNYLPIEPVHAIMKDDYISLNNDGMPSFEIRKFVTSGFIDFVLDNIGE